MSQVIETSGIDVIDKTSERSPADPDVLMAPAPPHNLLSANIIPDFSVVEYIGNLIKAFRTKLDLLQKWLERHSRVLARLFGLMKRPVAFVGTIVISLVGLVVWSVMESFKHHKDAAP